MHKDIEVTDPRGFVIRCSGEYWEKHILVNHPELAGYEPFVERALQSPTHDCIFADKRFSNRQVYYGPLRHGIEMKVVVRFDDPREGVVVSAAPCSKRQNGEKLTWHR